MKYYYYFKKIALYLIPLIIASIVCYYLFVTSTPNYIEQYQQTIDSAQNNIDSLKTEIVKSDIIIDSLHKEIIIIDKENIVLKEKIVLIKQEANEKINNVDKLNISELNQFFTDRYKY
jgi:predicted  nucleic acid-binding Zn-ribbon protein